MADVSFLGGLGATLATSAMAIRYVVGFQRAFTQTLKAHVDDLDRQVDEARRRTETHGAMVESLRSAGAISLQALKALELDEVLCDCVIHEHGQTGQPPPPEPRKLALEQAKMRYESAQYAARPGPRAWADPDWMVNTTPTPTPTRPDPTIVVDGVAWEPNPLAHRLKMRLYPRRLRDWYLWRSVERYEASKPTRRPDQPGWLKMNTLP